MKLATQILLGFLIAISIDLLDSFVSYTLTLQVKKNLDFVDRSDTVIRQANMLNKSMLNMQSSFRGFLLTGDETYLGAYFEGQRKFPELIARERSVIFSPGQRALLDSIALLNRLWTANSDTLIKSRRAFTKQLTTATRINTWKDTGFRQMRQLQFNTRIVSLFAALEDVEYRERDWRKSKLTAAIERTDHYSLLISIILVLAGAGIAIYVMRAISRRIRAMVQLAERISKGNFGLVEDNKQDELSDLSVSLNAMSTQLSRNIDELKKRNSELDQFAYVVSHDLKAPVRGISNVVSWIKEDLADEISPAMQKYLDYIPERISRMEGLIDGLLRYGRAGREVSAAEAVNVADLVEELAEYMVPQAYKFQIGRLPVLFTQRLPLQQVFSNLIGNAVKYTPAAGAITISCKELAEVYEFSIKDNGPGIPPEYHEKVFGLFQTLREKEDKESTGIGLAIVRKIVHEHGGTVTILSSPGAGATFIFTWPKVSL